MNKKLLSIFLVLHSAFIFSQNFSRLNINNVNTGVGASGELFNRIPFLSQQWYYPFNNTTPYQALGNLWIAAADSNANLHLTAQNYGQAGLDLFQGPMMTPSNYSATQDALWDKTWKLNKTTVDSFVQGLFGSNIPNSILNWPGNGNTGLGQAPILAPFYDANGDGIYVPSAGDHPLIKGDQCVFFIFNDDRNTHGESGGAILGFEIHGMMYAFNCPADSALFNTTFLHYELFNRSARDYTNLRIGLWYDLDMGNGIDDMIGTDSVRNACFFLNGSLDGMAAKFLNMPLQKSMYYKNDATIQGNPMLSDDIETYLNGQWKDSLSLTYGGSGYGGVTNVDHFFTGDPYANTGWLSSSITAGDHRTLMVTQFPAFASGAEMEFDMALVFAKNYGSIPFDQFNFLRSRMDSVQNYFDSNTMPCGGVFNTSVTESKTDLHSILLYPNPATDELFITCTGLTKNAVCEIYDVNGKRILEVRGWKLEGQKMDVRGFADGLYFVRITDGNNVFSEKFVKQ
jgi:hypothetical protein